MYIPFIALWFLNANFFYCESFMLCCCISTPCRSSHLICERKAATRRAVIYRLFNIFNVTLNTFSLLLSGSIPQSSDVQSHPFTTGIFPLLPLLPLHERARTCECVSARVLCGKFQVPKADTRTHSYIPLRLTHTHTTKTVFTMNFFICSVKP